MAFGQWQWRDGTDYLSGGITSTDSTTATITTSNAWAAATSEYIYISGGPAYQAPLRAPRRRRKKKTKLSDLAWLDRRISEVCLPVAA